MFGRAALLSMIAASALAMPAAAQAPAPSTAFDGKYVGVSRVSSKTASAPGAKCPSNGVPAPLTITNGVVRAPGSGGWEGTVKPDGSIVMHNPGAMQFAGQIDSQGTIRGQYGGPACTIAFVWRKQSR